MKLFTYRKEIFRPQPYPCWIVYEKTVKLLFGLIPIKSSLKKVK